MRIHLVSLCLALVTSGLAWSQGKGVEKKAEQKIEAKKSDAKQGEKPAKAKKSDAKKPGTQDPKQAKTEVELPVDSKDAGDKDEAVPIPDGATEADIRAIRGANAMLRVESRLGKLLKKLKVKGEAKFLRFSKIDSWIYEDGFKGMPKSVKELDGKKFVMAGFMLPIDEVEDIKEFLLVQSLWSCCYGQPPDINGIVRVVMKGDARIDYQFDPIKVMGQFKVEATFEDGYCVDIFQLEADSVDVIK